MRYDPAIECPVMDRSGKCRRPGTPTTGFCSMHHQRWRKHGDPLAGGPIHLPWPENLLERMEPQPNGCIYFTGHIDRRGYGYVWNGSAQPSAHRAAYEHFVGPIPDGMTIDHECHNIDETCAGGNGCLHRRCVNPEHLAPKSIGDNTLSSRTTRASTNAAKTHCPKGHPYSGENLIVDAKGWRRCRTCKRQWD